MKRVLLILLTLMICLGLGACVPENPAAPAPLKDTTPSAAATAAPSYPEKFESVIDTSKIGIPPKDIFSTPASENGHSDTTYCFTGKIKEYNTADKGPAGYEDIVLETPNGDITILNAYGLDEIENAFSMPKDVGSEVSVYAQYVGYSDAVSMACANYGNSDYFAGCLSNSGSITAASIDYFSKEADRQQKMRDAMASTSYDKINVGMTLKEVQSTLGFDGEEKYTSDDASGKIQEYRWDNDRLMISVWFKDGVAYKKNKVEL